jgi:LCP family protein required for cell wall assembly
VATLIVVSLLLVGWPLGLALWANGELRHVEALVPGGVDVGRTYLVAGSDERGSGGVNDSTTGSRADSILLLHVAENGQGYLISIPRDTYVELDEYGGQKIASAYAFGGPQLLVEAVQDLTGSHIDHYVEVGFGSVVDLVDAVGGVRLCMDADVDDKDSKLKWTAGCHDADGALALAFSRMRKADPLGDIGRGARQRQVVAAVMQEAISPALLWQPWRQIALVEAGTGALTVDEATNIVDLGRLLLDFRAATGPDGIQGTPPIANIDYRPGGIGSAVLLDQDKAAQQFRQIREGAWGGSEE